MRRKFTVYGLRFSKTSFWNRINTGFLDPAAATAPTACGIETGDKVYFCERNASKAATAPTACGIETHTTLLLLVLMFQSGCNSTYRLRY